jgi:hypothetical protein
MKEVWWRTTTTKIRMREWKQEQKCKASKDSQERRVVGQRNQTQSQTDHLCSPLPGQFLQASSHLSFLSNLELSKSFSSIVSFV